MISVEAARRAALLSRGHVLLLGVLITSTATPLAAALQACDSVTLGADDIICSDETCSTGQPCTCAAYFRGIPTGDSCTSMCASFGMTCTGRHGDGFGGANHRCDNYAAGTVQESCGAIGDSDDVCLCTLTDPAVGPPPPTHQPSPPPTPAPVSTAAPVTVTTVPVQPPSSEPTSSALTSTVSPSDSTPSVTTPAPVPTTTACSTVILGHPEDVICLDACDTVPLSPGLCTCAVYFKAIPSGGSCTSMCGSFGMACGGRHGDGPGPGHRCDYFDAGTVAEECDATGDSDDVCLCTKPLATALPTAETTAAPVPPTAVPVASTAASAPPTASPVPSTASPTQPTAAPVATTLEPAAPSAAPVPPTAAPVSPTPPPTASTVIPTSPPPPPSGCSTVTLGHPEDVVCADDCDVTVQGACTCAVYFKAIPSGGSCTSMCGSFGMACGGRHGDGPGPGHRCDYFDAGTVAEACDATGDSDDVCVCTTPMAPTDPPSISPTVTGFTYAPTHAPTPPPTPAPVTSSPTPDHGDLQELSSISFGAAQTVGNLPSGHTAAESQGVGFEGKLYYFGGFDMQWTFMNKKSSVFTATTGHWASLPDVPIVGTGITHCGNALWPGGRKIILAGGLGLGYTAGSHAWPQATSRPEVLSFDVDSHSWQSLPSLPDDRGGNGAAVVGATLYVFGGAKFGRSGNHWGFQTDQTETWSMELTNTGGGWTQRGSMNVARNHLGAGQFGGIIYAMGGQLLELEGCTNMESVEAYNPATHVWSLVQSMPIELGHIGPSILDPVMNFPYGLLVVSGVTDASDGDCSPPGHHQFAVQYYKPISNTWSTSYFDVGGASMVSMITQVDGGTYIYVTRRNHQKFLRVPVFYGSVQNAVVAPQDGGDQTQSSGRGAVTLLATGGVAIVVAMVLIAAAAMLRPQAPVRGPEIPSIAAHEEYFEDDLNQHAFGWR